MLDPRLVTFADPAPLPSAVHVVAPFSLDQRPWSATLAISMSRSGRAETSAMLPHSDGRPVRFAAAGVHLAPTANAPVVADVEPVTSVESGELDTVADVVVDGPE